MIVVGNVHRTEYVADHVVGGPRPGTDPDGGPNITVHPLNQWSNTT